jgi:hypothetical protein
MTVCKIVLRGKSLKKPVEKLLLCLKDLSKNPFFVTWTIDGKEVDVSNELDLMAALKPPSGKKDESLLSKYANVLKNVTDLTRVVELRFKIPYEPPFGLINTIHQIHRTKGLDTSEIIYHGHKGCYGYQKFLQDGTVVVDSKSREMDMTTDQVDNLGLPVAMEGLDLNSSSTFIESVPKGEFADFLKEHGMDY